ncbi:MAG: hypothetical protein V1863_00380 [Candidatus Omnitrophota bacterium]
MEEVYVLKIFNLIVGCTGLGIGLGIILMPHVVSAIERKLDKTFSTERLEKVLNERKNLSEVLLKHPRIFGWILFAISFPLVMSSIRV